MNRRKLLGLVLAVAILAPASFNVAEEKLEVAEKDRKTVVLTIDYGDGAQKRFPEIRLKSSKTTVLDVLIWASEHPHGIKLVHRGKGALAMVRQIDDLKNGGGKGKNWIFRVNGELGDRSCGASEIRPGDEIEWKFDEYK